MSERPTKLILRERLPGIRGEEKGWLLVLEWGERQRELLAVLTAEVGLEVARKFAQILALKYGTGAVLEELSPLQNNFGYSLDSHYHS